MSFGKDLAKKCVEIAALTIASEGTKAIVQAVKAKMFIKYGLIEIVEEDDEDDDDEKDDEDDDEPEEDDKPEDSGVSYRRARKRRRRRYR